MESGSIEIEYLANDGTNATVTLNEGNSLTFEPEAISFTAPAFNLEPAVVIIDGEEFVVPPNGKIWYHIEDLCPCDIDWKNHGEYVSCVTHAAEDLVDEGLITPEEKDAIVSDRAKSGCGKKK